MVSFPSWSYKSQTKVLVGKVKEVSPPISAISGLDKYRNEISGDEFLIGRVSLDGVGSSFPKLSTALT